MMISLKQDSFSEEEILQLVSTLKDDDLAYFVETIPLPFELLQQLKYHENVNVVRAVVKNPSACSCLLHELIMDTDSGVRKNVVAHVNADEAVLHYSAFDLCEDVRAIVATRPEIRPETVSKLVYDSSYVVRERIASCQKLEFEHVQFLIESGYKNTLYERGFYPLQETID